MQNHETDRRGNRNGTHDGNLFNSFHCDKKLTSQTEEHQPDPSTKWNPVEILDRENFVDKFFDSRPSFVGENFETNFEERLKSRSKTLPESLDLETSPAPLNHSGHYDDDDDEEFDFFNSLSEDELRCFTEVVIGVAKEEESKMRKANAKLLRELLYFRGEVNRAVRENNFRFDSSNDLLPNDFMFDDNIETYEALLQKRQPVLYQHIVGATQPEQLCHVMQDIRGVMDNLDMARSLVTLNFLDSNCSSKDPSEADQKKFEGRDGTESKFQFVGDETIKRPKYVSVFSPQKIEEVRERTNVASPVDEVFARFNNLGIRISSESWVTVDTVDLNSENDKIDSILDYEMSRGSWTPDRSVDFKNEPTLNTEMKPNNDKEVEQSADKKHYETDRTNRAATKCCENSTDKEYEILKSLVRELFQKFLRSSYFTNPGFVESVDDAIDFDLQPNISLNQQGYKNIDTDSSSKTVQFGDLSLTVKPDLFDFSSSHSPSCRSIVQREPEQQRPIRALQPIRQQLSIPHYSSIWLTNIARLSLENFLRTSSIPVVQASNLPHKLKIKPKNTGSQIATHTKLPQTSHVETITSIQNASRLNFFSANDSTAVSKSTVTSNPSQQSKGCEQLAKYCNKPCKLLLVKQITNFQDHTADVSNQFFSSTPSLKWIVKWLKKPLRVHQAVLPTKPIKTDPLEISLQDQSKEDAIKANKNNMQFTMVEVEIRDLTQSDRSDANAAAVAVDKTPAITSTTTTNVKPNVIIKTLNPSDIFTTPLTQTSNVITTPSTSHHNTHHPPRIGKIPMKQQRRRHIYRNI